MENNEFLQTFHQLEKSHYLLYLDENVDKTVKHNICVFFLGFILKFHPQYELVWFTNISIDALDVKGEFKYGHR